jgi:hypothetical protein
MKRFAASTMQKPADSKIKGGTEGEEAFAAPFLHSAGKRTPYKCTFGINE